MSRSQNRRRPTLQPSRPSDPRTLEPRQQLEQLRKLHEHAERARAELATLDAARALLVDLLIQSKAESWASLAKELGVTRQALQKAAAKRR